MSRSHSFLRLVPQQQKCLCLTHHTLQLSSESKWPNALSPLIGSQDAIARFVRRFLRRFGRCVEKNARLADE